MSSAIGSIMVAPRTLQALAGDFSFPSRGINRFLFKGKGETNEPYNATLVTVLIALFFVILGNVNSVAEIISMFFMVTYGSLVITSYSIHYTKLYDAIICSCSRVDIRFLPVYVISQDNIVVNLKKIICADAFPFLRKT